jgi:hypothetical protein
MIFQSNSFFYFLRYIGAAVLGGFALSLANVAQAQADLEDVVEEIIVTGSHIARSEFSNPIPIAVMDSEDIATSDYRTRVYKRYGSLRCCVGSPARIGCRAHPDPA